MTPGAGRLAPSLDVAVTIPTDRPSRRMLNIPLYAAFGYLGGTFLLFLMVGQTDLVRDMLGLTTFVAFTLVFFAGGYLLRIRKYGAPRPEVAGPVRTPVGWIRASALYYALYGLTLLSVYGAGNPSDVFAAISSPGTAYLAKFEIFEQQTASGASNPMIQALTLIAVFYTPLIPFAVLFWPRLRPSLRVAVCVSAGIYIASFLFIGTLKGIGDLLVFFFASYLIRTVWLGRAGQKERRRLVALTVFGALTFVGYMAYNQSQRIQEVGIESRFQPNPVVASVVGNELASGLAVVAFYPTHGYVGLAYNLDTPFQWSNGLGASRALDSYWTQYVGGKGASESAYPFRTEARTGWPAGMYWSTIYPWLASDITFPGAVAFMGLLGWFYARFWYEAAFKHSLLSVLLFVQLTMLVFYIPANNQIGLARTSLIAFVCLTLTYVMNRLTRTGYRK